MDDEQKKTEDGRLKRGERTQEESQPQNRSKARKCVSEKRKRRRKKLENGRRNSWKKEGDGQEARVEKWREQEKKGDEEEEDEQVHVVPSMEAGGSYLQTAYPRDEVEKIVMDGLEERKNRKRKCRSRPRERGTSVNRTRPAWTRPAEREKEKEKGTGGKGRNTVAKDDWEARVPDGTRGVKRLMNRMKAAGRT